MIHLCIGFWLISATTTILEGCFLVHSPWPICCWCCCRCRLCWCRCCCCSPTTPCSQHKLADLSSTPPLNCTLPMWTQRQAVRVCTQGWSGRPRCTGTWSGTRSHPGISHFDFYHHHHEEERPQAQLESCRRVCRKEVGETTFPTRYTFSQQSTPSLCNSDFQMLVFGCSAGPRLIHTQFKISDLGDFHNY